MTFETHFHSLTHFWFYNWFISKTTKGHVGEDLLVSLLTYF